MTIVCADRGEMSTNRNIYPTMSGFAAAGMGVLWCGNLFTHQFRYPADRQRAH